MAKLQGERRKGGGGKDPQLCQKWRDLHRLSKGMPMFRHSPLPLQRKTILQPSLRLFFFWPWALEARGRDESRVAIKSFIFFFQPPPLRKKKRNNLDILFLWKKKKANFSFGLRNMCFSNFFLSSFLPRQNSCSHYADFRLPLLLLGCGRGPIPPPPLQGDYLISPFLLPPISTN